MIFKDYQYMSDTGRNKGSKSVNEKNKRKGVDALTRKQLWMDAVWTSAIDYDPKEVNNNLCFPGNLGKHYENKCNNDMTTE